MKIPKKALYVVATLSVIGLFIGHIWLINKLSDERATVYQQESSLREKVFTAFGVPSDKRYGTEAETFIANSPEGGVYAEFQKKEQRLDKLNSLFDVALLIWPIIIIVLAIYVGIRYWEGKGLETRELQVRRYRAQLIGVIAHSAFLTLLIIFWRSGAFLPTRYYTTSSVLILPLAVAFFGILLVNILWNLMSSPLSRLSTRMNSVPLIYRLSIKATVVAITAFVMTGDVNKAIDALRNSYMYTHLGDYSLILLGAQSVAWLATVVALGSVMLGYLRLPNKNLERSKEERQREESLEQPPKKDIFIDASHIYSPNYATDLSSVSERMETLISMLDTANHRTVDSSSRTHKRQRAQRSDEVVRQGAELIRQRLLTEVHSLTKRGNVNLMIGSVTSLIAATILWMLVAQAPKEPLGTPALVGYYIPRLSVAVFIEVFSFFFLRLYKNGLSEIMYYQNELTNLDSKMLALEIAASLPSGDSLQQILQDLSKTDRNFVLKGGESTVELEKIKVDQQNIQSLFDSLLSKITEVKDAIKIGN